ncbi:MAG TPA: hypothetical protein VFG47_21860 [Geminicoccaceae bacterium]|nr:hypothetical protein [Geminicoccaceae bacterium]
MRREDRVGTGFGLLVAPLLFGLYLAVTESGEAGRGGADAPVVGAGDRYDVRLRCPEDVYQRERLRATSYDDALAGAEARHPGCKAVSADRPRG